MTEDATKGLAGGTAEPTSEEAGKGAVEEADKGPVGEAGKAAAGEEVVDDQPSSSAASGSCKY